MTQKADNPGSIDVLYVHLYGNQYDHNIPVTALALMNSISCSKLGVYYHECTEDILKRTKILLIPMQWYLTLETVRHFTKEVHEINPDIKIVTGGLFATIYYKDILQNYDVDFVIRGDPWQPFKQLVDSILNGNSDIEDIPNIASKDTTSEKRYFMTSQDVNELDFITINWFPGYEQVMGTNKEFFHNEKKGIYPWLQVFFGCCFDCLHCYAGKSNREWILERPIVARDPEYVIKDIRRAEKMRLPFLYCTQDFMTLGQDYVDKILSQKYDIVYYHDFYNVPSIETIDKFLSAFKKCHFSFCTHANHNFLTDKSYYNELKELLSYLKDKGCDVTLWYDQDNPDSVKESNDLKENFVVETGEVSSWKILKPNFKCKDIDIKIFEELVPKVHNKEYLDRIGFNLKLNNTLNDQWKRVKHYYLDSVDLYLNIVDAEDPQIHKVMKMDLHKKFNGISFSVSQDLELDKEIKNPSFFLSYEAEADGKRLANKPDDQVKVSFNGILDKKCRVDFKLDLRSEGSLADLNVLNLE